MNEDIFRMTCPDCGTEVIRVPRRHLIGDPSAFCRCDACDKKYVRQIKRLVNVMSIGRPADPRDCDKWDREIVRAERLLEELPNGEFRDHFEEAVVKSNLQEEQEAEWNAEQAMLLRDHSLVIPPPHS
jgi:hypothetical protein